MSTADDLARLLIGEPTHTPPEVAAEAGVDLAMVRRLWRALGFPPVPDDQRVFTAADVATLRAACALIEQQSATPDVLLQLARVTGQSLARVADAQVGGVAEGDGVGAAEALAAILPVAESLIGYVWRRHLLASLVRSGATAGDDGERTLCVGFADLVGFTAFSQRRSTAELAAVVDRFETLAYEHIPERGGRVIKMIGDEVMFATDGPAEAAAIALALVEAYAGDATLPDVRVGLACGPVLAWGGDLYGPTVNLASRLVNIAYPATVLASEDLGQALLDRDDLVLRHLRPESLKGIGRVRMWVVRRKRLDATGAE